MKPCWTVPVLAGVTFALCGACASAPDQTSEHREEKVYQTGSNIPIRDRDGMANVKTADPAQVHQAIHQETRGPTN